jgi:hypothetical protein
MPHRENDRPDETAAAIIVGTAENLDWFDQMLAK